MAKNDHVELANDQLHVPKDFVTASLSSEIHKDACGNYVWVAKLAQSPVTSITAIDLAPPATIGRFLLVEGDTTGIHNEWGTDVTSNDIAVFNIDADSTVNQWCPVSPSEGMFAWVDEIDLVMVYTGSNWKAMYGGVLYSENTDVATAGATEETLATYTLPGYTLLNDNERVKIEVSLIIANNANAKVIRVKFGASTYIIDISTVTDRLVIGSVEIIITSQTTQKTIINETDVSNSIGGAAVVHLAFDTAAEDLATDTVISLTGDGVAASDIIKKSFKAILQA